MRQKIKKYLEDTVKRCKFKQAFIPFGWTCIDIDQASKDLSELFKKELAKGKEDE